MVQAILAPGTALSTARGGTGVSSPDTLTALMNMGGSGQVYDTIVSLEIADLITYASSYSFEVVLNECPYQPCVIITAANAVSEERCLRCGLYLLSTNVVVNGDGTCTFTGKVKCARSSIVPSIGTGKIQFRIFYFVCDNLEIINLLPSRQIQARARFEELSYAPESENSLIVDIPISSYFCDDSILIVSPFPTYEKEYAECGLRAIDADGVGHIIQMEADKMPEYPIWFYVTIFA